VLLEVDQDRRPAAFLIGDELDSGHASILPARISLGHRTALGRPDYSSFSNIDSMSREP
jgi:hypothetical protein